VFEFGNDGPSVLLVAIDGSDTSLHAGAYAAGLARRQNSRLVLLFVHVASAMIGAAAAAAAPAQEASDALAAELRQTVETQSALLGLDATFIERTGNPYSEILAVAEELRVDAVVVGASSKAGHRIVGSLGAHLVKTARWPVIVVP
jgi:nucleotide-binding universal stress UspA family protein